MECFSSVCLEVILVCFAIIMAFYSSSRSPTTKKSVIRWVPSFEVVQRFWIREVNLWGKFIQAFVSEKVLHSKDVSVGNTNDGVVDAEARSRSLKSPASKTASVGTAAADVFLQRSTDKDLVDTSRYDTLLKGYLAEGKEDEARQLLTKMAGMGWATAASYHGLLKARAQAGDVRGAWKLVSQMQASGVSPTAATCTIVLTGRWQASSDMSRALALVDAIDQPLDDALVVAVAEVCTRLQRFTHLFRIFDKFKLQNPPVGFSDQTYGTTIAAFGLAHDRKRVWDTWSHMMCHQVAPSPSTFACMVEALIQNGQCSEAWRLAKKLHEDEETRTIITTGIYSVIIQAFGRAQELEKVAMVYKEMKGNDAHPDKATFNSILNAFAQCGSMQLVPTILEDMAKSTPPVERDIFTYTALIKGFVHAGHLDRALNVFEEMQSSGKFTPDEILYNNLLTGCAKETRPDEAMQLIHAMCRSGLTPSSSTLIMLVKLMARCGRLEEVSTMLQDMSKEFRAAGIQVYACLIQAYINYGQVDKAIAVHDEMIEEGIRPDAGSYTLLVQGCLRAGMVDNAVDLAMSAHSHAHDASRSKTSWPGMNAGCLEALITALGGPDNERAKLLLAKIGGDPRTDDGSKLPAGA